MKCGGLGCASEGQYDLVAGQEPEVVNWPIAWDWGDRNMKRGVAEGKLHMASVELGLGQAAMR